MWTNANTLVKSFGKLWEDVIAFAKAFKGLWLKADLEVCLGIDHFRNANKLFFFQFCPCYTFIITKMLSKTLALPMKVSATSEPSTALLGSHEVMNPGHFIWACDTSGRRLGSRDPGHNTSGHPISCKAASNQIWPR